MARDFRPLFFQESASYGALIHILKFFEFEFALAEMFGLESCSRGLNIPLNRTKILARGFFKHVSFGPWAMYSLQRSFKRTNKI
jgi:hypothetical protein